MRPRTLLLFLILSISCLGACGGTTGGGGDDIGGGDDAGNGNDGTFDAAYTRVRIEIDYETGSEPYTGPVVGFGDSFDLSTTNLERLFSGSKELFLPNTLGEMEDVGSVPDEELTVTDLLALADQNRDLSDAAPEKTFYLIWVSGNYTNNDGVQSGVLGVSIGSTGVVAMFKDVIESTGSVVFPNLERFVEQSVLIHEMGHAVGLVENGVPAIADHHDDAHGAHCSNDQCVMYWLNEGASDMAQFARDFVLRNDSILFDDDCLADVDALTGGP